MDKQSGSKGSGLATKGKGAVGSKAESAKPDPESTGVTLAGTDRSADKPDPAVEPTGTSPKPPAIAAVPGSEPVDDRAVPSTRKVNAMRHEAQNEGWTPITRMEEMPSDEFSLAHGVLTVDVSNHPHSIVHARRNDFGQWHDPRGQMIRATHWVSLLALPKP